MASHPGREAPARAGRSARAPLDAVMLGVGIALWAVAKQLDPARWCSDGAQYAPHGAFAVVSLAALVAFVLAGVLAFPVRASWRGRALVAGVAVVLVVLAVVHLFVVPSLCAIA